MDYESESILVTLLIKLMSPPDELYMFIDPMIIHKIIIFFRYYQDWDSQPKPESEFMSLITHIVSLFSTMDLDSQPKPLKVLISLFSIEKAMVLPLPSRLDPLLIEILDLEQELVTDLISLIRQVLSLVLSRNSIKEKFVSLSSQAELTMEERRYHVHKKALARSNKWPCFPLCWQRFRLKEKDVTYFHCLSCNGENHKEYHKAPVKIKHTLHQKHSLWLVFSKTGRRKCYCCDEELQQMVYYCQACDLSINFACADKQPVLTIEHPKWHQHTLALFPRRNLLTCDACALTHSNCPYYTCPPCDFVIHQSCISLPRLIRISRHLHRIKFTPSFDIGDWFCGVCRSKIDNDYGGYCCIKNDCSYKVHSKCATQSNLWDGEELEGKPEEIEEVIEPFVRISAGIIQHFLHQHHHLRIDENTERAFDDNRQCQACVMPIYFGNLYSCMQCDFILHEECANLSRKIYHPLHQHMITLVGGYDGILDYFKDRCSACSRVCKTGFFYKCNKERCDFQLQVQCAMISEPLVHESHLHPLYLTSKPRENEYCSICNTIMERFNCIECDFSLCFKCATLPQTVRYKHDKHTLTLSYGKESNTMTSWCDICETKIHPGERFYKCDEYCCVTLHIKCVLGAKVYMKADSFWMYYDREISVLRNNHMSRPICSGCAKRCPHKIVFQLSGSIYCSMHCAYKCS